ncbi:MAG: hypothetical protein KDI71_06210 [Xanthomonadales bacterium]|nr:hypothetical protein [Xanthomonadales bacterium]
MLLRRFTAAIRRQDWFQVLVEILIVVAGILIALQVDNWNEERKARQQGELWRLQIIADLEQSIRDLQARRIYYGQALRFGEAALAAIEAPDPPTGEAVWDTVLGAFQAGQIWPYQLTGPSYREVQSEGSLGLIGSQEAQAALALVYDVSAYENELVTGGLPPFRGMIRERLSWPIQKHIWASGCQLGTGMTGTSPPDPFRLVRCDPPADQQALLEALQQMRDDVELQRSLRGRLSQLEISVSSTARRIERVRGAIALLQS